MAGGRVIPPALSRSRIEESAFPTHAGRENPSLENERGAPYYGALTANGHMPAFDPSPQPEAANTQHPTDELAPVPATDPRGFLADYPGPNPRYRTDHLPAYDDPLEHTLRVNERLAPPPDYHPYADALRDSDFDPHRTMVQHAYTVRDFNPGGYELGFDGAKSLAQVRAQPTFGQAQTFGEDPRRNRNRPRPDSYGDQTGEGC